MKKDLHTNKQKNYIDFRSGVPELKLFPRKELSKLLNKYCMIYQIRISDMEVQLVYGFKSGNI
ncbi:hypothetical protein LA361_15345 [Clostridioides difficile]|nr:hypothetical protein [Clostridioides difficile]